MPAGNPDAEDARPNSEPERRIELQRLPVHPCRDRMVRLHLELRRAPLAPGSRWLAGALATVGRRAGDGDAEHAVVDPGARARANRTAQPVTVVGDEDRCARLVLVAARPGPAEVERLRARPEDVGRGVEERAQLGLAVAG